MPRKILVLFFFIQLMLPSITICEHAAVLKSSVTILDKNPITESLLTILRDTSTSCNNFQEATHKLTTALAFKAGTFLSSENKKVQTPTNAVFDGVKIKKNPILVPVLRAGLSMLSVFQTIFKGASVGMVGHKRNEETAAPILYYLNLPSIENDDTIIILEPMLATGGSLSLVISLLKQAGALEKNIIVVTVIGAPQGVQRLLTHFPQVRIVVAALDPELNDKFYIVPGLGDFGDRYFGNDNKPDFEALQPKGPAS